MRQNLERITIDTPIKGLTDVTALVLRLGRAQALPAELLRVSAATPAMIAFAAKRLIALETETLCGSAPVEGGANQACQSRP